MSRMLIKILLTSEVHEEDIATKTFRMTWKFKDAGVEVDPLGDLDTETERKLGTELSSTSCTAAHYTLGRSTQCRATRIPYTTSRLTSSFEASMTFQVACIFTCVTLFVKLSYVIFMRVNVGFDLVGFNRELSFLVHKPILDHW